MSSSSSSSQAKLLGRGALGGTIELLDSDDEGDTRGLSKGGSSSSSSRAAPGSAARKRKRELADPDEADLVASTAAAATKLSGGKSPRDMSVAELDVYRTSVAASLLKLLVCVVCYDSLETSLAVTHCGHVGHSACLAACATKSKKCPTCQGPLTTKKNDIHPLFL